MIYTMTMNPAIDYVVDLPEFKTGEVNRVLEEHIFYGGKGINVSVILRELGFESCCLGFVAGFTGSEMERGLKEELGLSSKMIHVDEGMTRINVKIHSQEESELNGMGPRVKQKDVDQLFNQLDSIYDGDVFILSGSVPHGMSKDIYCDILKRLSQKSVKVVVDATGDLLMNTLAYHPFLIKPNNHELADLFHTKLETIDDIEYYARQLQKMGAQNVLISMAKDGSLLIDENGVCHRLGVYQGIVKNSVGAGDSMVAGFVAGYLLGYDYQDTLKLATASGGATAFSSGLASRQKIEELLMR